MALHNSYTPQALHPPVPLYPLYQTSPPNSHSIFTLQRPQAARHQTSPPRCQTLFLFLLFEKTKPSISIDITQAFHSRNRVRLSNCAASCPYCFHSSMPSSRSLHHHKTIDRCYGVRDCSSDIIGRLRCRMGGRWQVGKCVSARLIQTLGRSTERENQGRIKGVILPHS